MHGSKKQHQSKSNSNHHDHRPLSSSLSTEEYDDQMAKTEAFLDEHPAFFQDYLIRKGRR